MTLEADIDVDTALNYDTAALVMAVQGPSEIKNVFTTGPLIWEILYSACCCCQTAPCRATLNQAFDGDPGQLLVRAGSRKSSPVAVPSLPGDTSTASASA